MTVIATLFLPMVASAKEQKSAKPETVEAKSVEKPAAEKEVVFKLEAFRPLESDEFMNIYDLRAGAYSRAVKQRFGKIKKCPELKSDNPWYGMLTLDYSSNKRRSDTTYYYVVDESEGTGKGYDRLYFDANQNLDLTDDPVLEPMKEAPPGTKQTERTTFVCFDYMPLTYDQSDRGKIEVMPRLRINKSGKREYGYFQFVPTVARRGRIRLGDQEFDALLAHRMAIDTRFDTRYTGIYLVPVENPRRFDRWTCANQLNSMRVVDDKWYSFSATPDGDQLTVHPYRGELGVLEIGPGKREFKDGDKLTFYGGLRSKKTAVPAGDASQPARGVSPTRQCKLPVGDYEATHLTLRYGSVTAAISPDYYDPETRRRYSADKTHSIKIRKDKPFVLDFSAEPEIMFASPKKGQTLQPGEQLRIAAMLVDPVMHIKYRQLYVVRPPKVIEVNVKGDAKDGAEKKQKRRVYQRPLMLEPTVTITNSSGKEVARGKMPFG
jgi:hypothetical protein